MKKRKRILLVLLAAVFSVAGLVSWFISKGHARGQTPAFTLAEQQIPLVPDAGQAEDGRAVGRTQEELLAELKKQQMMVTDTLSSNATFVSGKPGAEGNWIVENVPGNKVIQQAEIYMEDLCVARSAALSPGQHMKTIKLLREVPAGTHSVTAYLNYFSADTKKYIGKAGFNIKLTIAD